MVQQKKLPNSGDMPNGNAKMGREQASMSFQKKDVADVHVMGTALPNRSARSQNGTYSSWMHEKLLNKGEGSSAVFRTDAAISGNRFHGERTLKAWVPDDSIETDMSLESGRNKSSAGGAWNQFEANERLFGLTTDYDENIYTTTIDKSKPDIGKRYAEADRKAREIEGSAANNSHVAEERIVDNLAADDSGVTEEDK
jgi:PAB1-binding protein PBP1